MALEVLYGPVDITVDGVAVAGMGAGFTWLQGIGFLTVLDPTGGSYGFYAVQMDGAAQLRSDMSVGLVPVLDLRSARGLAVSDTSSLYNFNWIAGYPDATALLTPGVSTAGIAVITVDRYLKFSSGTPMQALESPNGVTFTAEYTFPTPAGYTFVNVSRGRTPTEVCITYTNGSLGQLRFYDVSLKKQIGETLYIGESFDSCWYVPKYDVFVEIKNKQVKILANSINPSTLSNPTAITAVTAGRVSKLRVQLLGAQSEPCVGELVNWSIASGSGSLSVPQSVTDVSGYAYADLIEAIGTSGSVVV